MYERLAVRESSSLAERKKAYRTITRVIHPDTVQDEATKSRFNEALARVNEAYETLRDPEREASWRARHKADEKVRGNTHYSRKETQRVRTPEQELGREFERASLNGAFNLEISQIFELVDRLLEKQHVPSYRRDPLLTRGVQQFIKAAFGRAILDLE